VGLFRSAGSRLLRRPSRTRRLAAGVLVVLVTSAPGVRGQPPAAAPRKLTQLRQVTVSRGGDTTIVTIEADGPLPAPRVGTVDSPPRIYLDFPDVVSKLRRIPSTAPAVRAIRIAPHGALTRVVLDLLRPATYRLDPGSEPSRLALMLNTGAPVQRATRAAPVGRNAPNAGQDGLERYARQTAGEVESLGQLRAILTGIEAGARDLSPEDLRAGLATVQEVQRALWSLKPVGTARSTHSLLGSACTLAVTAFRLRLSPPPEHGLNNASSAAAGALLVLDRALADLKISRTAGL
jgi:hypothetical protein